MFQLAFAFAFVSLAAGAQLCDRPLQARASPTVFHRYLQRRGVMLRPYSDMNGYGLMLDLPAAGAILDNRRLVPGTPLKILARFVQTSQKHVLFNFALPHDGFVRQAPVPVIELNPNNCGLANNDLAEWCLVRAAIMQISYYTSARAYQRFGPDLGAIDRRHFGPRLDIQLQFLPASSNATYKLQTIRGIVSATLAAERLLVRRLRRVQPDTKVLLADLASYYEYGHWLADTIAQFEKLAEFKRPNVVKTQTGVELVYRRKFFGPVVAEATIAGTPEITAQRARAILEYVTSTYLPSYKQHFLKSLARVRREAGPVVAQRADREAMAGLHRYLQDPFDSSGSRIFMPPTNN